MYALRQFEEKSPDVVDGGGSNEGRIFVHLRAEASTSAGRGIWRTPVGDFSELEELCNEVLGSNLSVMTLRPATLRSVTFRPRHFVRSTLCPATLCPVTLCPVDTSSGDTSSGGCRFCA